MNDLVRVSHPDAVRVAKMISGLAETFGEPLSETRLEGYLAALADVPTEALRAGLQHAMRTAKFFPRPAEVRTAVDAALAADRRTQFLTSIVADEYDPRTAVRCTNCRDAGWAFVEDPDGKDRTYVQRCHCNPKGIAPPTYGEREREYRR